MTCYADAEILQWLWMLLKLGVGLVAVLLVCRLVWEAGKAAIDRLVDAFYPDDAEPLTD
jgi:hypothetical protein